MHTRARIVAGTALALVMSAYAGASAQAGAPSAARELRAPAQQVKGGALAGHVLLAQAAQDEDAEEERRRREAAKPEAEEATPEEPAASEPPAADEPVPEPAPREEAPAEPEAAQPPQDDAPAPGADEETGRAAEPLPAEPAPPQDAAPQPPAQETPPPASGGAEPLPAEPAPPQDAAPQPPAQETPPPASGGAEPLPAEPAPPQDAAPQPPAQETPPPASGAEPLPAEPAPPQDAAPQPPAQGGQPGGQQPADSGVEPVREAPLLDSDKEEPAGEAAQEPTQQPAEAAPPPVSDEEAQQFEEPVEVESLRAEEGRRVDRREERRERREGTSVLREIGDRIMIQLNNQVVVQSDDRGRIERDAAEVYYEELPRGRTRETVVRANGVQVVTVYDRYGDVIRRSRIMPDGREHVLVYAGDRDRGEERRQWRDPGLDLPPLRLTIPRDEYILDAGQVRDERAYYDFLAQPPVDRVRRPYSVDEVRYSARVRDIARRVDLDTITFDFGSATISEDAIPRLAGVADAMERLLEANPGEVFLIEGHTDAVGSDQANLALSDRRAEAVATAMTNVFAIPPENLVTQGYGERYLKIATQEPERENRRVAIRRITPLVAPVASAQ